MAIIKCPECGHPVSDKAPTCPTCGVEIAGKITTCTNCGTAYFSNLNMCPNCHCPNPRSIATPSVPTTQKGATTPPVPTIQPDTVIPPIPESPAANEDKQEKKSNRTILICSFIFALIVCGTLFYFYHNANEQQEEEAYEYAMQSNDPDVLQSYLDTYKDADQAHIDSIMSHLNALKTIDNDWTNAVVSGCFGLTLDVGLAHAGQCTICGHFICATPRIPGCCPVSLSFFVRYRLPSRVRPVPLSLWSCLCRHLAKILLARYR